jgi:hypothetical protein
MTFIPAGRFNGHIKRLACDNRGFPVPWFVQWTDAVSDRPTPYGEGRPRFQMIDPTKWERAVREKRCWVCGDYAGARRSYVIGPMCTVTLTTAEPGCHHACAVFAACTCPFLTRPRMRRLPEPDTAVPPAGIPLARNPGVVCVWTTRRFHIVMTGRGPLIRLSQPDPGGVAWFREGRTATRDEVLEAIHTGLPELRKLAAGDGPDAIHALDMQVRVAMGHVPGF